MAAVAEATDVDFEQTVIGRSQDVPVVVDFWAPWCGPCRSLGPVLEQLAAEASGRWELVKVNVDDNPKLAIQYGIQGIPAVKAFHQGKEVAQFVGAQPRPQVEVWLATFLPDPAHETVEAARAAERQGDLVLARSLLDKALAMNPQSREAQIGLERIALVEAAAGADEIDLAARLEADPADVEAAAALARVKLARGDSDFSEPLVQVIASSGEQTVRKAAQAAFLELAGILPPEDARLVDARRRLASVLYR